MMNDQTQVKIPWNGWRFVRRIGRGGFGTVYEIERNLYGTVEKAAMKVISVPESRERLDDLYGSGLDYESVSTWCSNRVESIVREYSVMSRFRGKTNIVSCDDIEVVPHTNDPGADIYIRMEKLTSLTKLLSLVSMREDMLSEDDKETLRKLRPDRKEFTEEDVIKLGKDISRALEICEKNNIVHRDIKPENILISDDGDYNLGDFGTARKMDHTTAATFTGTERYMAPEVIKGGKTGKDVDTYALGLVMYRLLNRGRLPFYPLTGIPTAEQVEEAQRRRLAGEPFDPPVDGSPELKALVMKSCSYDRNDRFASAAEMTEKIEEAERVMIERSADEIPDPVVYDAASGVQESMTPPSSGTGDADTHGNDDAWDDDSDMTVGSIPAGSADGRAAQLQPDEDKTVSAAAAGSELDEFIIGDVTGAYQDPPQQPAAAARTNDQINRDNRGGKSRKKLIIAAVCLLIALCVGLALGGDGGDGGDDDGSVTSEGSEEEDTSSGGAVDTGGVTFRSATQDLADRKVINYSTMPDSYNPAAEEYYISRVNSYSDCKRDAQGHPLTDNNLVFLKYGIGDFDGDGLVEWATCRYNFSQESEEGTIPCVEVDLWYFDGSTYSLYPGTEFRGKDFDPDTVTFYNNMVWFEEFDKDGKHYTYVHFLDYFEDETRGELIKKFCPKHGEGLVYIDDGSGTIIREEAYYRLWDDEDTKTVISHEDYEAEIYEITKDAEIIHPEFKEYIPE